MTHPPRPGSRTCAYPPALTAVDFRMGSPEPCFPAVPYCGSHGYITPRPPSFHRHGITRQARRADLWSDPCRNPDGYLRPAHGCHRFPDGSGAGPGSFICSPPAWASCGEAGYRTGEAAARPRGGAEVAGDHAQRPLRPAARHGLAATLEAVGIAVSIRVVSFATQYPARRQATLFISNSDDPFTVPVAVVRRDHALGDPNRGADSDRHPSTPPSRLRPAIDAWIDCALNAPHGVRIFVTAVRAYDSVAHVRRLCLWPLGYHSTTMGRPTARHPPPRNPGLGHRFPYLVLGIAEGE